jgi:hypothetical protein
MSEIQVIEAQGGGYGPPPGGGGGYGGPPPAGAPPAYGGPPPNWTPPGAGGPGAEVKKQATTWLIISAVSFFFCGGNCLALVGAILCFLAMQGVDQGQLADAESKLKLGRTLTIVGFALYALLAIVGIIYYFVVIAAAVASS